LMGYDEHTLYLGFQAFDDPSQVQSTLAKRDDVFSDDYVGVFLDTYNDQRSAYELFFNPVGIQADGVLTQQQGDDFSVDIVMESKGEITSNGYTVEVAIPFKSLRYEAGKGREWGINFIRRIQRFNQERDSWMPMSRDISGVLNQEGHIVGIEGLSQERTLDIIPSLTLSETGQRIPTLPSALVTANPQLYDPGHFVNKPVSADLGLTMKYTLTPNVVVDFTVNPDFAQVEADQPVVTANQRFPIFFPEKRPFFLEGIDTFQTPLSVVHTRTIIEPAVAAKITGKIGRDTFGALLAVDKGPGSFTDVELSDPSLRPSIAEFIDKKAYIGILRLEHDLGKQDSSIGLIATSYSFIQDHNTVVGVDGRLRVDPKTIFSFQVVGTTSRKVFFDPAVDQDVYRSGQGIGYAWAYDYTGRYFGYQINGQGRTDDYRADLGFTRRTNTNTEGAYFRFSNEPKPGATLISWRFVNYFNVTYDWQARTQGWTSHHELSLNLSHQSYVGFGFETGYERLFESEFGASRGPAQQGAFFGSDPERSAYKKSLFVNLGTTPTRKYSAYAGASYTPGQFDYDLGAGGRFPRVSPAALFDDSSQLDPGPGRAVNLNAGFVYQPTDAIRASIDYTKSQLTRYDTNRTAFDDNVYSLRVAYQFSRFTFMRLRLDHDTVSSKIQGQYLFGWAPNPGTAFYAGYDDDINWNGYNPFTGQYERGFRRNSGTFFIKLSYLIRRSFG
ncbi:MAG: DUF5916 domain-containing protein, partial [Blastocatellia bacterium]